MTKAWKQAKEAEAAGDNARAIALYEEAHKHGEDAINTIRQFQRAYRHGAERLRSIVGGAGENGGEA